MVADKFDTFQPSSLPMMWRHCALALFNYLSFKQL
jgi:hypothetical protein